MSAEKEFHTQRAAFHEAGHAITAWLEGVAVVKVTVIPEEGNMGHVLTKHGVPLETDSGESFVLKCWAHIRVNFGGLCAEYLFCPNQHTSDGARGDHAHAADLASALEGGSTERAGALLHLLYLQARDQLSAHEDIVKRLAARLMADRELNAVEFKSFMTDALMDFEPTEPRHVLNPKSRGTSGGTSGGQN